MKSLTSFALVLSLAAFTLFVSGCNKSENDQVASKKDSAKTADKSGEKHDHDHSGWWCAEHGVPEEECSRCDSSLIAEFKKKGDWCKEHNRPESQCFICSPKRAEKFNARYEAKFGKKPPKPTE